MDVLVVGQEGSGAGMVADLVAAARGTPLLRRLFSYDVPPETPLSCRVDFASSDLIEAKAAELVSPEFRKHFFEHRIRRLQAEMARSAAACSGPRIDSMHRERCEVDWRIWESNCRPKRGIDPKSKEALRDPSARDGTGIGSHAFLWSLLRRWRIPSVLLASYEQFRVQDLKDFAAAAYHEGDFCLVHVVRNPVACAVAHNRVSVGGRSMSVFLDPAETDELVRNHRTSWQLVGSSCGDTFTFDYSEFLRDPKKSIRRLYAFLEVRDKVPAKPLAGRSLRSAKSRLSAYAYLYERVSRDTREAMEKLDEFS